MTLFPSFSPCLSVDNSFCNSTQNLIYICLIMYTQILTYILCNHSYILRIIFQTSILSRFKAILMDNNSLRATII